MSAALLFRRSGATKDLPMSPTKTGTVLVVEDEPTVRALAGSILADSGYLTLSAANAREAIALLEAEQRVDILFTDINIPDGPAGLDGLALARAARELRPGLRVLYTSGGVKPDGMTALLVDGAGFLQKPYKRDDLLNALDVLMPLSR
jgi:CheY-like chemotaxis protein